jgi:GTPase SAR1 family protein
MTNVFSDHYQTTIGVTVEKKSVSVDNRDVMLMLWDLYGEDELQRVRESYLRGSSGYILVMDGTRKATVDTAIALQQTAARTIGAVPFVSIINKADVRSEWEIDEGVIEQLRERGWTVLFGSAKLGQGVEELFAQLATRIVSAPVLPRE